MNAPRNRDEIAARLNDAPDVYVAAGERYECPCGCLKVEAPARGSGFASMTLWCIGCGRQVEVAS